MKRLILLLLTVNAYAALPATGIIEIRSTATAGNVNGCGFSSARGGTDYTLQDAAQTTNTDAASTASTTFTSALGAFTSAMVGNYLHLTAATGTPTLGWYEIVTYVSATQVTLDRNSGTFTLGTYYVGGACPLNSTLDDDLFEIAVAGNTFYVKNTGTYTLGEAVSISASGSTTGPILIVGYNSSRTDAPTGSTRPTVNCAALGFFIGSTWAMKYMILTGTGSSGSQNQVFHGGSNSQIMYSKVINTSTTANRAALGLANSSQLAFSSEAISYRGYGIFIFNTSGASVINCWVYASNIGLDAGSNQSYYIVGNIFSSNVTNGMSLAGANVGILLNNTLYGSENKQGVGVTFGNGASVIHVRNNIVYGFTTGFSATTLRPTEWLNWNDVNNNTTNYTNVNSGANDITTAPAFVSVAQVTGTTGKFAAGNDRLIDTSANFTTAGVVAGRDYLHIKSGTGATAGIYGVSSITTTTNPNDTLVLDIAPGTNTTADKVYQLTTGQNFAVGANMAGVGFPGVMPGALSTGYMDIGAVQRQATSAGTVVFGTVQ